MKSSTMRFKGRDYIFGTAWLLTLFLFVQAGCSQEDECVQFTSQVDPLQVQLSNGGVLCITLTDAIAYHHRHEDHPEALSGRTDLDQELCIGVASGFQAIRFATSRLFPDCVPDATDITLSVHGNMPGIWDVFELYVGKALFRQPRRGDSHSFSLDHFVFEAKRLSTGEEIVFRLRKGLIPARFFKLKSQGRGCADPEIRELKRQASLKILKTQPIRCFDLLEVPCG